MYPIRWIYRGIGLDSSCLWFLILKLHTSKLLGRHHYDHTMFAQRLTKVYSNDEIAVYSALHKVYSISCEESEPSSRYCTEVYLLNCPWFSCFLSSSWPIIAGSKQDCFVPWLLPRGPAKCKHSYDFCQPITMFNSSLMAKRFYTEQTYTRKGHFVKVCLLNVCTVCSRFTLSLHNSDQVFPRKNPGSGSDHRLWCKLCVK